MSNKKHRYHVLYTTNNGITERYIELDDNKCSQGEMVTKKLAVTEEAREQGYNDLRWRIRWDY